MGFLFWLKNACGITPSGHFWLVARGSARGLRKFARFHFFKRG